MGYNGYSDSKTVLEPEDDVAQDKWGGKWRIPTIEERDELQQKCTWEWETINGIDGYIVTSTVKGYENRFIFLPAAGVQIGEEKKYVNQNGHYWTSTLYANDSNGAFYAYVYDFDSGALDFRAESRHEGLTIRAVCE